MLSLDVESLFLNIPVADTMEFVIEFLEKPNVPLNEQETLMRLSKLCMKNSHYTYRRKYYKLNFGCAIHNPLSPFIANILGMLVTYSVL